jgi:hypothetical protein
MLKHHRIAIIVPTTVDANQIAAKDVIWKWMRLAKMKFARLFGGFTAHKTCGGWVSSEHGLIEEEVTVITSFTDDDGLGFVASVKEFAAEMPLALNQEAVSVEVDHQLGFVSPLVAA